MGQCIGMYLTTLLRRYTKKLTCGKDDKFGLDGYGSEKWEVPTFVGAMQLSSNPVVTSARYHTEQSRQFIDDYYMVGTSLGKGMNGHVVLVKSKSDGQEYALKRFQKHRLSEEQMLHLCREVQICLSIDHPGIARLHDVYDTKNEMRLLMECCRGGEMFDRLQDRGQYVEQDAADAAVQMFRAVNYLHTHRIVHRDIKLENFLYESSAGNAALKLIDFGLAKVWDPNTLMMARCGSLAYVSPDALMGIGYTSQCDVWSLGVVVFMLLSGYPPFHGTGDQIRAKIKGAEPNFRHTKRWQNVSRHAQDFVCRLLQKDPCMRPTAHAALHHRWLRMNRIRAHSNIKMSCEVLSSLRTYMHSSKARRAALQLLAQELLPDETLVLREMFLGMDLNDDGTVSLAELKEAIRGVRDGPSLDSNIVARDALTSVTVPTISRAASQTIAELFDVLDANGDAQVYYSDFLAAASQMRSCLRVGAVRKVFNRLDVDRSGTISASDLYEAIGEQFASSSADDLLHDSEVTLDGRGEITFEAFLKMLERHDAVPVPQLVSGKHAGEFGTAPRQQPKHGCCSPTGQYA